jgi:hypothetical protein
MAKSSKEPQLVTVSQLLEPRPVSVDIDSHKERMAKLRAEQQEKRQLLDDCLNPIVAARYELAKDHYTWRVKAVWIDASREYRAEESVCGQSENDAWAGFCDRIGYYPSRKHCRELSITRGKKLNMDQVSAHIRAEDNGDEAAGPREVVTLSAKKKAKSRL